MSEHVHRYEPDDGEPVVRGLGWCYNHRTWCGADIGPAAIELTEAAKEEHRTAVAAMIEKRHFTSQLLSWAHDPAMQGTVPNTALLAGALVEIATRLEAIEQMFKPISLLPRNSTDVKFDTT